MSQADFNRDDGTDKTDRQEDAALAKKMLDAENRMPFFEAAPPVRFVKE